MTEELTELEVKITRSFQIASWGHMFPQLRLVSVEWRGFPVLNFYVDGELSDDDVESINLMDTYFGVHSSYSESLSLSETSRIDAPSPIRYSGECMYARKEAISIGNVARPVLIEKNIGRYEKICVAGQRSMIGLVFPQLRFLSVSYDDTTACLYAVIDGAPLPDDAKSLEMIRAYFEMQFPQDEMTSCKIKVIRRDGVAPVLESFAPKEMLIYQRKDGSDL